MSRPKRMANCHPDRPHFAKGLCKQCYWRKWNRDYEEKNGVKRWRKYYQENEDGVREYYKWNREEFLRRARDSKLKCEYGITVEEYDEMLEAQGNKCAICGKTPEENGKRLAIDHDHETDEIRSLLCGSCNLLLGHAKDSIKILSKAIVYLEEHKK